MNVIKQRVKVLSGGRIEIIAPELEEGSEAEVIVLFGDGIQSTLTPQQTDKATSIDTGPVADNARA